MTGILSKLNEIKKFTSVKDPYYGTIGELINISNFTVSNIKDAQEEVQLLMRGTEKENPHYDGLKFIQNMLKHAVEKLTT